MRAAAVDFTNVDEYVGVSIVRGYFRSTKARLIAVLRHEGEYSRNTREVIRLLHPTQKLPPSGRTVRQDQATLVSEQESQLAAAGQGAHDGEATVLPAAANESPSP